jgi:hypothetical protein
VSEIYETLGDGPLTDEQLIGMEQWAGENDQTLGTLGRLLVPRAARELRARRAADLTSEDVEALRHVRGCFAAANDGSYAVQCLALLDRLIQGAGK